MTEIVRGRHWKRRRLWLALIFILILLAVATVPPLVSVSHYKSQITSLIARSVGRPVRLSSVEVRLLPRPGFVLSDLIVEEDPAYGAEPVLHAETVTASIRMLSLWRGKLEIGRISVDNASLNLVREPDGHWNLDPLFRTATTKSISGASGTNARRASLPYLEATNSRINIKNGAEKLPYSLVGTDLSFWQENPGDWRIRLRGQPARTDLTIDLADTGIVRLEASMRRARELREMPVHLDLEWREAQLGQLTRLLVGSDPGWRGDLTGELHLDGTADAAHIKTRLRAIGVHRAEFAPATPLDFDANCDFLYHFSARAIENLACDSPLGDGTIHFAGNMGGENKSPQFSVELNRIPVGAGLDALRTVRSDFAPGLEVKGAISGKISYAEKEVQSNPGKKPASKGKMGRIHAAKVRPDTPGPLTGSLTVDGFELSGDGLRTAVLVPKIVMEPVSGLPDAAAGPPEPQALSAKVGIPAGGAGPLNVGVRLSLSGYEVTMRGQASIARVRELAHVAGIPQSVPLDALAGDPMVLDLIADGPWLPAEKNPLGEVLPLEAGKSPPILLEPAGNSGDHLTGTLILRNANWKAAFLANHLAISNATVSLGGDDIVWDPVNFTYGPVKGTGSLRIPTSCVSNHPCPDEFQIQFGVLDASALQAALLGAHEPNTLLSTLIERLSPTDSIPWPKLEGSVKADSFIVGPVTLQGATAAVQVDEKGIEFKRLGAGLLGGTVQGSGSLRTSADNQAKPNYIFSGSFAKLSPSAVGQLMGWHYRGGTINGEGKIDLAGFTEKDLAASAKGNLHFEWKQGSIGTTESADGDDTESETLASPVSAVPLPLTRFDRWSGDAEIADGAITLKESQVRRGVHQSPVAATVTLGSPVQLKFASPKETQAKR